MEWLKVKVWGPYACFARPEFSVERLSYDVMTPSAARGILEAIFWKPEFPWEVREIWILNQIRHITVLRNELAARQGQAPIFVEEQRQQRTTRALKDVAYLILAEPILRPHATDDIAKYRDQFRRRIDRGQCYHMPYLGTREFAAYFAPPDGSEQPFDPTLALSLGTMFFDWQYRQDTARPEVTFHRHGSQGVSTVKGWAEALFFQAKLRNGMLIIPPDQYKEVGENGA
jgi:CRISPR-associated protein Cas5d